MKNTLAAMVVSFALLACGGSKDDASAKKLGPAFDDVIAAVEGAKGDCAKVATALETQEKKHRATFAAFSKSMKAKKKGLEAKYKDPKDMGKVMAELLKDIPKEVMAKGMKLRSAVGKCRSDKRVREIQAKFKAL